MAAPHLLRRDPINLLKGFPQFVNLQFVDLCGSLGIRGNLSWRPRDTNEEVGRTSKFATNDFSDDRG